MLGVLTPLCPLQVCPWKEAALTAVTNGALYAAAVALQAKLHPLVTYQHPLNMQSHHTGSEIAIQAVKSHFKWMCAHETRG